MPDILLDASYIVALGYPLDRHHQSSRAFAAQHGSDFLVPDAVLVEALFNLQRLTNFKHSTRFLETFNRQQPRLIGLLNEDVARAVAVMRRYKQAELDFVDCCLTALAERLNIVQICTFDRRDFSMIVPRHAPYFELLP